MKDYSDYLAKLANSSVGRELVKYLKDVEIKCADIRNLNGVPAEVRIDALKIWRSELLDKLLVLAGEVDPPNNNEFI